MPHSHRWQFFRLGGLDQVALNTPDDLRALPTLDFKLWVALACPVKGLSIDEKTLSLIDLDKDNRVRAPELLSAVQWTLDRLADPAILFTPGDTLPASAIVEKTPDGHPLRSAAIALLQAIKASPDTPLTLKDYFAARKSFDDQEFNGDGILTLQAVTTPAKAIVQAVVDHIGSVTDETGRVGITRAHYQQFKQELSDCQSWATLYHQHPLFGMKSVQEELSFIPLISKINEYFSLCEQLRYNPTAPVNPTIPPAATHDQLRALPLSLVNAESILKLNEGINPAWRKEAELLRTYIVQRYLKKDSLTHSDWLSVQGSPNYLVDEVEHALESRPRSSLSTLLASDLDKLQNPALHAEIEKFFALDEAQLPERTALSDLEKLIRLRSALVPLCRNYVNFFDFYSPDKLATFQAGTLYIDSRSCQLCIEVADPATHSVAATPSRCFVAYVRLMRPAAPVRYMAAILSQGDADFITVGRNGLFIDRDGSDWDATVVRTIDQPISIGQAFWDPYKKLVRFIEEQVAKQAASQQDASTTRLTTALTSDPKAIAAPAPAVKKGFDVGTVAALGVGLGAVGTLIGGFVSGFLSLGILMPLGILGIILGISLPSVIIATLKLRQRTLGPILDANLWAINARVKINIPLGVSLTDVKKLPATAQRHLNDPFEDKESQRRSRQFVLLGVLAVLLVLYFYLRHIHWL